MRPTRSLHMSLTLCSGPLWADLILTLRGSHVQILITFGFKNKKNGHKHNFLLSKTFIFSRSSVGRLWLSETALPQNTLRNQRDGQSVSLLGYRLTDWQTEPDFSPIMSFAALFISSEFFWLELMEMKDVIKRAFYLSLFFCLSN